MAEALAYDSRKRLRNALDCRPDGVAAHPKLIPESGSFRNAGVVKSAAGAAIPSPVEVGRPLAKGSCPAGPTIKAVPS
jgi:hypothetical protein